MDLFCIFHCMCIIMCIHIFFSLQEQFPCRFEKAAGLTNNYNIYPILKMPSNGLPAWFAGMVKVPVSRRFSTKNSNLKYQFLDDPCFWLPCVAFGVGGIFKVPISRNALHKMGSDEGVSEDGSPGEFFHLQVKHFRQIAV